ncbi:PDZ domain-containing protein 9 [Eublepharis macularius]|uniref:PDZ domain-containing protein 9 n=1 Tax=Eublepharis macularius TaxID=481883 RepID=A0AA97LEU2_EUBMA|nr:PDZ domain-containing protein 9 [Eublepharis macularius]
MPLIEDVAELQQAQNVGARGVTGHSEDEDSEHSLSTTVKTNVQMEKDGLGFILIQNGPYIQLIGLVEKSAAARDGELQAGDVLIKVGHENVLGWTLRELRQRLQGTPVGTVLQIRAYRDFLALPKKWAFTMDDIPERKGGNLADIFSDASEGSWTSSEGTDEYAVCREEMDTEANLQNATGYPDVQDDNAAPIQARHDKTVHYEDVDEEPEGTKETTAQKLFAPSPQPHWISKDWHFFERKRHTFTVGSDIGCDIMIHKDLRAGCDTDVSTLCLRCSSPYWTMPKVNIPSSPSSSSLSDVFWLKDSTEDVK